MQRFLTYIESRLGNIYSKNEIKSISRLLLTQIAGLNSVQIYSDKDTKFTDETVNELNAVVDRLFKGEPVQYILGKTEFFGLDFKVRPGVLIPRPETEELVELILKDFRKKGNHLKILDIGNRKRLHCHFSGKKSTWRHSFSLGYFRRCIANCPRECRNQ